VSKMRYLLATSPAATTAMKTAAKVESTETQTRMWLSSRYRIPLLPAIPGMLTTLRRRMRSVLQLSPLLSLRKHSAGVTG
jgi:hypothetical protein